MIVYRTALYFPSRRASRCRTLRQRGRLGERHPLEQPIALAGDPLFAGGVLDHGLDLIRRHRADADQRVLEI